MKRKEFFKNFGTILIYAVLGTLISIFFIGFTLWGIVITGIVSFKFTLRESLAFSSLISATDPVSIISAFKDYTTDPNFFQIVFGESILNDAISIVLYDTCIKISNKSVSEEILYAILSFFINTLGSTALGLLIGFLTAVFLKIISGKVKNIEKIEISLMIILPWVSYLIAQVLLNIICLKMLNLSGIVSLLFNGIAHATYTKPNLTDWSKITVKTTYEGISNAFETLIFIFLGLGFFSFRHPFVLLTAPFIILLYIVILLSRFCNIWICSKLANISRNESTINNKRQFFLWFSGVRGAMAFALSIKSKIDFPNSGSIFLLLTLLTISFTLLYSTIFLDCTLKKCDIINICEADNFEESELRERGFFDAIKYKVEEINKYYLYPCVVRVHDDNSRGSLQLQDLKTPNNQIKIKNEILHKDNIENQYQIFDKRASSSSNNELNNSKKTFNIKNMHLFE